MINFWMETIGKVIGKHLLKKLDADTKIRDLKPDGYTFFKDLEPWCKFLSI